MNNICHLTSTVRPHRHLGTVFDVTGSQARRSLPYDITGGQEQVLIPWLKCCISAGQCQVNNCLYNGPSACCSQPEWRYQLVSMSVDTVLITCRCIHSSRITYMQNKILILGSSVSPLRSVKEVLSVKKHTQLNSKHHTDDIKCLPASFSDKIKLGRGLTHIVEYSAHSKPRQQKQYDKHPVQ